MQRVSNILRSSEELRTVSKNNFREISVEGELDQNSEREGTLGEIGRTSS